MKLHWISPYATDKNIGKAINDAINTLKAADEDWICLTDHDILFLQPDTKAHIEQILLSTDFKVLGCLTNRLRMRNQLYERRFDYEGDISIHVDRAKEVWGAHEGSVTETREPLAAFMLCFQRSTWAELGGFASERLNFDLLFGRRALKGGYKTGIMQGIYVFHLYRWGSKNPVTDINHLI